MILSSCSWELLSILFSLRRAMVGAETIQSPVSFNPLFIEARDNNKERTKIYNFQSSFHWGLCPVWGVLGVHSLSILFSLRQLYYAIFDAVHALFQSSFHWGSEFLICWRRRWKSTFNPLFIEAYDKERGVFIPLDDLSILFSLRHAKEYVNTAASRISFQSSFHWGVEMVSEETEEGEDFQSSFHWGKSLSPILFSLETIFQSSFHWGLQCPPRSRYLHWKSFNPLFIEADKA